MVVVKSQGLTKLGQILNGILKAGATILHLRMIDVSNGAAKEWIDSNPECGKFVGINGVDVDFCGSLSGKAVVIDVCADDAIALMKSVASNECFRDTYYSFTDVRAQQVALSLS